MKLSLDDKIEIVRLYEKEKLGYGTIATKYNIANSSVETIIKRYKINGIKSLKHPPKRQKYTADLKMNIIKQVYEGKSKTSLAAEYSLPGPGTIVLWMQKYEKLGYNGLIAKRRGRPKKDMVQKKKNVIISSPLTDPERKEFEELKREYNILKKEKEETDMENEFLKKLDALVQERLKHEGKK